MGPWAGQLVISKGVKLKLHFLQMLQRQSWLQKLSSAEVRDKMITPEVKENFPIYIHA